MKTIAVVPVKRFDDAKQRLADAVPAGPRAALAEAMFLDVLTAIQRCEQIDQILVVTADPSVAQSARTLGASVLDRDRDAGHPDDAASGIGAALVHNARRVALIAADCPMLDPAELDQHLASPPPGVMIVPDRHGTGTNALVLTPPDAIAPGFGPDSCARHIERARDAELSSSVEQIDSLALDLDTPEDLDALRDALVLTPGRAPRTAQLIWEIGSDRETGTRAPA